METQRISSRISDAETRVSIVNLEVENRKQFERFFDYLPGTVLVIDAKGRILQVYQQAEKGI